jgi:V/A-type H+/Na+-transporting ATPase subunit K
MDLGMIGPAIILGLGCLGSSIGCAIAGMASHGVMTHVDEGHGKFIGLSAVPSSQSIYAVVLTVLMSARIKGGHVTPEAAIGIAIPVGLAFLFCAVYQGKAAATAIQASAKQPAIFGKCSAAVGIVESFALFAFVFTLLII